MTSALRGVLAAVAALAVVAVSSIGAGAAPARASEEGLSIAKSVVSDHPDDLGISNVPGVASEAFGYQLAYSCSTFDPSGCTGVVIHDRLPAELEVVGDIPSNWTLAGQDLEIDLGTIPAGNASTTIPVRFRTDPSLAADDTRTVQNTAQISGTVAGQPRTADSQTVSATGRVKPVGGLDASKTATPSSVDEFSGAPVAFLLSATNAGTVAASGLDIEDLSPAFFDAFDVVSIDAPTLPAGASGATVEVTADGSTWTAVSTPFSPSVPLVGVRVSFDGAAAGAAGSLRVTASLRDHLRSTGAELVSADTADFTNQGDASVHYVDPSLDRDLPISAKVTVRGETVAAPVLVKRFSPASVIDTYGGQVLTTIQANGGGYGGASTVSIADPASGDGVTPFGDALILDGTFGVTWPSGAETAELRLSDGTTTTITAPTTSFTLPSSDLSGVTGFTVTFRSTTGGPIVSGFAAAVTAGATLKPGTPDGVYRNDAESDVDSASGNSSGTSTTPAVDFTVMTPHAEIATTKSFTRPLVELGSPTQANVIQLRTVYGPSGSGTNVAAGRVVVQDPAVLPTAGTDDFFDEFDITSVRAIDCGPGDAAQVEIYDGTAWVVVAANACGTIPLSIADPDAQGIRFTYTNADGIAPGRAFQPEVVVTQRLDNRETGDAVLDLSPAGAGEAPRTHDSPQNCSAASVSLPGATTPADTDTVAAPCPVIVTELRPDAGGVGIAKSLSGADGTDSAREGSGAGLHATLSLTQRPAAPTSSLAFQDPAPGDVYSQVFAAVTDIAGVGPFTVPQYERARVDWLDPSGAVIASSAEFTGGQVLEVAGDPGYAGFRLVIEEDPADPGIEPGIESATYDTLGTVNVDYQLRDTFRSAVAGHAAGDLVRNDLCYTVDSAPLTEGADGNPDDPAACQLGSAPFGDSGFNGPGNVNDGGWILNNAEVTAAYRSPDVHGATSSSAATTGEADQVFRITNSVANAQLTKTIAPDASVPLPLAGETPAAAQERTVQLAAQNTAATPATSLTITDGDGDFWSAFELVSLAAPTLPGGAAISYGLTFSDGRPPMTGLADLSGVPDLGAVDGITAEVTGSIPASATATAAFVVRLRATITAEATIVNTATVVAASPFATSEPSSADATVTVREPGTRVDTSKSIALAAGSSADLDLGPVLDTTVRTTNTGELSLASLVTEDDDALDPADYPGVTLPANVDRDFWTLTDFDAITAISAPAGAETVRVERYSGSAWVDVASYPTSSIDLAALNAALAGTAVEGLRATFTSTSGTAIAAGQQGSIEFTVTVNEDATPGSTIRNCAESGYRVGGGPLVRLNPACASFTPLAGTPQVAITKVFANSGQTTATEAAGTTQRYRITVTNTGTQDLGARDFPFEVDDQLPATLGYQLATAQPVITPPSGDGTRSTLTTVPAAVVSGSVVRWTWPLGESLAPGESVTIAVSLEVAAALPPGTTVPNVAAVPGHGVVGCAPGVAQQDGSCVATAVLTVNAAGAIRATKTIEGSGTTGASGSDPACDGTTGFTSNPCVALTPIGSTYTWKLDLQNAGNSTMGQITLIDLLPAAGDTGAYLAAPRGSEWRGVPTSAPRVLSPVPDGVTVGFEYLPAGVDVAPCLLEVRDPAGASCAGWTPLAAGAVIPADAEAVRVSADYGVGGNPVFPIGARLTIAWDETVPWGISSSEDAVDASGQPGADGRRIEWNSFGFRAVDTGTGQVFENESTKAGALYTGAAIVVTKSVAGPAPTGVAYPFRIDCVDGTGAPVPLDGDPGLTVTGDTAAFALAAGETKRIEGLPLGGRCTVVETDAHGAATSYALDTDPSVQARGGIDVDLAGTPGDALVRSLTVTNAFATPASGGGLAVTGIEVWPVGLTALLLLLAGLLLAMLARRRGSGA